MNQEIERLIEKYQDWLKDRTVLRQLDDWVEVTTPYLDRHNDHLQIYIKKDGSSFILNDGGYILQDLRDSGCDLDTKKRKELLQITLNGFGIKVVDGEICTRTSATEFPRRKHNLIQAMLAVNDLFYLAEPLVKSLFIEDVALWLDSSEIRYTPQVKFTGVSGYDHVFEFVIPKSAREPERLIRAVNRPSRDTAETVAFAWFDTRDVRTPNSRAYAVLNDSESRPAERVIEALTNYDVRPVLWSERETVVGELAA